MQLCLGDTAESWAEEWDNTECVNLIRSCLFLKIQILILLIHNYFPLMNKVCFKFKSLDL